MKKFRLVFLLLFVLLHQRALSNDLWHVVRGDNDKQMWLLAYEEADFIKDKIGQWLPLDVFSIELDFILLWQIGSIERRDHNIHVKISVKYSPTQIRSFDFSFHDRGPNAAIDCFVREDSGEVRITIPCADGSTTDLMLGGAKDAESLASKYTISKAMPEWKWAKSQVYVSTLKSALDGVKPIASP